MMDHARTLITAEAEKPADPAIAAMAQAIVQHHPDALAILAYGSTLRDVKPDEGLIDLYVLTASMSGVTQNPISQIGCTFIPPNVYYSECTFADKTYRAKYAALTMTAFARRVSTGTGNPYFWARFAQPCRLVWTASETARQQILDALHAAATTAFGNARGLQGGAPLQQWISLFQNTYRTELRPESADRADKVVTSNAAYYESLSQALGDVHPIRANWALRRFVGKVLSVLRLIKAAFTFQGGADYIAWKIKRHSGVDIEVTDWQRRHPLLAGITLLPRLLHKGAIK